MPYLYHTDDDRQRMLEAIGLSSEDELFASIPQRFLIEDMLPIGRGLAEYETLGFFKRLGDTNRPAGSTISFLGGGIYDHIVPSIIKHLSSRSEFYTAYTPYQPEVSQGTLQAIFEYQTAISRLTGLPVANASMYDGATALAEAALMAARIKRRNVLLCAENVNPRYKKVLQTYTAGPDLSLEMVPVGLRGDIDVDRLKPMLGDHVAAVLVQTPNYFGVLECPWEYRDAIKDCGALLVACVDPISLSVVRPPGDYEADIAVGEGQSLGNDMNYGGPLLGFMACKKEYVRSLPGRLVSETKDVDGRRAFVLTLQTREQHIRREKATSNICTNQGLVALRATMYLSILGDIGFRELGKLCHARAYKLSSMIAERSGLEMKYDGPFFREFVVRCSTAADDVVARAREAGILAGIPLGKYFGPEFSKDLLVAVTEKRTDEDLGKLCDIISGD
ncbi:MAG: aminomethyl-transferring glycine dehydrogenase subunit GcvPA [Candidatus Latescibacterota bacterium]|nr:MAG: aminomethyl-transferring glycine dehydrogenase subunit GcvPA [Candidatus Latescibacterota bacterium]